MSDDRQTGQEALAHAWWEALDTLVDIAHDDLRTDDRVVANQIAASSAILNYTANLNTGLGEPFIPAERPETSEVEDD